MGLVIELDQREQSNEKTPTSESETQQQNIVYYTQDFNVWYGNVHALQDIQLSIYQHEVTAIIGPSGCGKSTYLKSLNRMIDFSSNVRTSGKVLYQANDIFASSTVVEQLRTNVGMVFQKPNPFPKSIFENVAYGPRIHGIRNKKVLNEIVEKSLRQAFIWDEVKDRLNESAFALSGGQQQRLCIARCLAIEPQVILMDEPTSALDPKSTYKIEQLIQELKKDYTIVIVTHNMQQAARISDRTAFFLDGKIIEAGNTEHIFNDPTDSRTEDYILGKFG